MKIINPNNLEDVKNFSMSFKDEGNDIFLKVGKKEISIRNIFEMIRKKYPTHFRGAIIYSEEAFRNNLRETSKIMSEYFNDYKIYWAMKSAPVKGLVKIAAEEGSGFDVGSYEELILAKGFTVSGQKIYHTAPGKFDWDINTIVQQNCVSISDNITELTFINEKAKESNKKITVGIRINPSIDSSTQKEISTGNLDCKFGIPELSEDFFDILKTLTNLDITILHMHIGSQISNPIDYERALENMIRVYKKLKEKGYDINTIDIGGGYPYKYLDNSEEKEFTTDVHTFSNYIGANFEAYISRIKEVLQKNFGNNIPCIAIEPGRHIAAGTAFALGYVLNTKIYPNRLRWIISSISVNDLFHKELIHDTYFDIHVLNDGSNEVIPSAIGGTLCFSGDILNPSGIAINLRKDIKRGDIIFYNNVGAYSILGSGNFHNMPRLPIFMIDVDLNLIEL
jgi:diaminopimelate decarboxylase